MPRYLLILIFSLNLAAADWRLSADEMITLDEVSALPEPYPMWHQHKFGIERNPRLPSMRPPSAQDR